MRPRPPCASAPAARGAGFTLLEVMIALAILGSGLVIISQSHQNSVRAAIRARQTTVATMLARYMMVEVEDKLFEEGFSDFDEEEKGDFEEEGFTDFTYKLKVDKVELPSNVNKDSVASMLGGDSSSTEGSSSSTSAADALSPVQAIGGQVLSSQFEMIRNVLEQSIRRVSISVLWKEGTREKAVTVVGFFTDPRKVDLAASGQLTSGDDSAASTGATTSTSQSPGYLFRSPGGSSGGSR